MSAPETTKDWKLLRRAGYDEAIPRQPGAAHSQSQRQAFMAEFFSWLKPSYDEAAFNKLEEDAFQASCYLLYKAKTFPTRGQLEFRIDKLMWAYFFTREFPTSPLPIWPWASYVVVEDPKRLRMAKEFEDWVKGYKSKSQAEKLAIGRGQLSVDVSSRATVPGRQKLDNLA